MKKYSIQSKAFDGEVVIGFNDDKGYFEMIDFSNSSVTHEQRVWMLSHLPANVRSIGIFKTATSSITELYERMTFENFWNKYDDKLNSSKKRTMSKWNKMSERDQQAAYNFLPKYFANIPFGTRKKYAETYLNSELWNN